MTVYLIDLESLPTRYTCEWKTHVPELLEKNGIQVQVIEGREDLPSMTTPGMFLNFAATNVYKSDQVIKLANLFAENKIKDGDYFLFTDAWHPGIINLKYMAGLLGANIKIGALWHAGAYDPQDGLGRLIGQKRWISHTEKAYFEAIDHNFFATKFHIDMFLERRMNDLGEFSNEVRRKHFLEDCLDSGKIVLTGWPMEYLTDVLMESDLPFDEKRDLIVFPHRVSPEKQVDIFKDLAKEMPEYEWVVCQEQKLSKKEYHKILAQSKITFSGSLQETLGIAQIEGGLLGSFPMVPDRLSYVEMFDPFFKYQESWTSNNQMYWNNKQKLINYIRHVMESYNDGGNEFKEKIVRKSKRIHKNFFCADKIIQTIKE